MGLLRKWAEEIFGLSYLDEARLWMAWPVVRDKMIPWFRNLLWDETSFVRYTRAGIMALSVAITTGQVPWLSNSKYGWWLAQAMPVLALWMGSTTATPRDDKLQLPKP